MSTQDSAFYRTLTIVLGSIFIFFIIIIVAAIMITDSSGPTEVDPRVAAKTSEQIAPVGMVRTEASAAMSSAAPAAGGVIDGAAEYQNKCFACHGTGAAGAPKMGDKAAWKARIAAGNDTLYTNAIKGKGGMPAKGGHAGLSDDAVKAIVDHMVSKSK